MNKHKFYSDQFVAETELNGIQDKNEAHIEKFNQEVISIDGFVFTGLDTVATDPASMTVQINIGSAWKEYKNIINYEAIDQVIEAADPTDPRIDLIAFKYKSGETEPTNVQFKNPSTGTVYVELKNITLRDWVEIVYVKGTPAAVPSAPAIPEHCLGSSNILVESGVTTIPQTKITDIRIPKPDYLVAGHRTANPIDHPAGSIFDTHIATLAGINLAKLSGVDFDSLIEFLQFATDTPMVGTESYTYDINGRLTQISYTGRSIIEAYTYDAETGALQKIELTSAKWKLTEAYTFVANKLDHTDYSLEAIP